MAASRRRMVVRINKYNEKDHVRNLRSLCIIYDMLIGVFYEPKKALNDVVRVCYYR